LAFLKLIMRLDLEINQTRIHNKFIARKF